MKKHGISVWALIGILALVLGMLALLGQSTSSHRAEALAGYSEPHWASAVWQTKQHVLRHMEREQLPADSVDTSEPWQMLLRQYPDEMGALLPYVRWQSRRLLTTGDGVYEQEVLQRMAERLEHDEWLLAEAERRLAVERAGERVTGLLELMQQTAMLVELQEQLAWMNVDAVKAALNSRPGSASGQQDPRFNQAEMLEELQTLVNDGFEGIYSLQPQAIEAANRALVVRRELLLARAGLTDDRILVSRYQVGPNARMVNPSALGTQPNNWSNQSSARRTGFNAELLELSDLSGDMQMHTFFEARNGSSLPDVTLHYDAEKVMFAMTDETGRWQVYEVGLDGEGLRMVIEPPENDLEFFDAAYLPDGRIIAVSNIGYQAVPCVSGGDAVGNLVLYSPGQSMDMADVTDPETGNLAFTYSATGNLAAAGTTEYADNCATTHTAGPADEGQQPIHPEVAPTPNATGYSAASAPDRTPGTLRRLTFDQDANWHPVVLNNGRVMYVRWEYTDLTHYFSRIVMHMNPDGTEQRALYGSGSVFPTSIYDVQPLPEHPTQFVGIISGHHGTVRSGRLILFDPSIARHEERGMVQELPFSRRPIEPIIRDEMVDGVWPQFIKPYPIDDETFLVTAKLTPTGLWGLYLVDVHDNLVLLAEQEGHGFIHGIPVRPRKKPPVIPDKVREGSREATVFIQDIYAGEGLEGVPRGTVSAVRAFAYEYAYNRSPSDHVAQGIQSGWDIKRMLGEVPVEEDGSVMFTIPANTPISLQPLDDQGRAIQWMRSWLTGMPGEIVSCVGCHERQNEVPRPGRTLASLQPPQSLEPPRGGVRSFTFELEVQPILDRTCVSCHNGAADVPRNYVGGRIDYNVPGGQNYSKSYLDLHPFVHRQGPEAGMQVLYPYEYHASVSPLIQMLDRGHYGVELTDEEMRTLYAWIDLNAPYHGSFRINPYAGFNQIDETVYDQYERRIALKNRYAGGMGVDWKGEIERYAQYLAAHARPEPVRPDFTMPQFEPAEVQGFPFSGEQARTMRNEDEPVRKEVEIAPGVTMVFVKIPAGSFVMGSNNAPSDYSPAHATQVEHAFWMSETEITNEQMRVLLPDHDSRFIDQQWKDHVNEGYPANEPWQPAIRVSWNDAMTFSRLLGEQIGQRVNLPTEQQWEWAARAGTDTPFWYGDYGTDFSTSENKADRQLNKLAVIGVDPQPMNENSGWFPYYTWHPKDESVDDGHMLTAKPGQYRPNAWGLYDMLGNVAEWTRSLYLPYPYEGDDAMRYALAEAGDRSAGTGVSAQTAARNENRMVVRGGSWIDPPERSTAYVRRAYLPWQRPYNVGFRVVIEP